jgi:hypothetical protein
MRRDDHRAVRTLIKRERWEREVERQDNQDLEREEQENKKRLRKMCFSVLQNRTMADLFGGGDYGEKMAEMLHRIEFDLPLDDLLDMKPHEESTPSPVKPSQTKSDPIRPNPTNFSDGHAPVASPHEHVY